MRRPHAYITAGCLVATLSAACYACCGPAAAPLTPPCCAPVLTVPAPSCWVPPPVVAPEAGVEELLARAEGLKTRREAIEREEREVHALLQARLRAQQERLGRVGAVPTAYPVPAPVPVPPPPVMPTAPVLPAPAVAPSPACRYEPVTTYRVLSVYDEKAGTCNRVVEPVTTYERCRPDAPPAPVMPCAPQGGDTRPPSPSY